MEIIGEYARKKRENAWSPFLNLLNRPDGFIQNMTSRIIAKLACWSRDPMDGSDLTFYLTWLKDQLQNPNNEYIQTTARCLQMMLRDEKYRLTFAAMDGVAILAHVLSGKLNFQVCSKRILVLFFVSLSRFLASSDPVPVGILLVGDDIQPAVDRSNDKVRQLVSLASHGAVLDVTSASRFSRRHKIIPILGDILNDAVKDKVTRIILAVFRNMIEKPDDATMIKENSVAMVQAKVLKQLAIMQQHKFDDEDIMADIEFLTDKLLASIQDLSSFDEYSTEVKSGRLEWSPVHKSERFWRENAPRLTEKNYELLKMLIHLLETSRDTLVLAVASYDIGEFVRHYPRGKR